MRGGWRGSEWRRLRLRLGERQGERRGGSWEAGSRTDSGQASGYSSGGLNALIVRQRGKLAAVAERR